jgi:hypothetical protein
MDHALRMAQQSVWRRHRQPKSMKENISMGMNGGGFSASAGIDMSSWRNIIIW